MATLLLLTTNTFAAKMTFELRPSQVRMDNSDWIEAEGDITEESAVELENYLNNRASFSTNKIEYTVVLNSRGGNLIGGIKLGECFRRNHFKTAANTGLCASACAIAFIGGVERTATSSVLGVHQFYQDALFKDPAGKIFNALDMSNQQIVSAILIDYAFRKGVDPRFVAIASATRPDDVHFFSNEELHLLRVNWNPKAFEPWAIETRGRGVVAFTASRDKTQTAVLFCRTDMVPRLFIKPDSKDIGWYKGALNALEGMSALGVAVPKNAVSLKIIEGGPALELALMGFEPNRINNEKRIGVGADGPRYMLSGFSFDLPKQNGVATTRVALKNCI